MVKKFDKNVKIPDDEVKNHIKADVIILGCSIPGIVAAHKLKTTFGDSMDIVVLDLAGSTYSNKAASTCNVFFHDDVDIEDSTTDEDNISFEEVKNPEYDNVSKYYIAKYSREFDIPLPDVIISPTRLSTRRHKLFQHRNGQTVECDTNYHDFDYLSFLERFELNQYQTLLDCNVRNLFKCNSVSNTKRMLYYDQTTMEDHICSALLFPTPREIMRTTVRLVCGASPENISVLFYLHQCYRSKSCKNQLDGDNMRLREKLFGQCRKRLASKLQQSVADIILSVKPIKQIRTYSDEQVILETMIGENNYVCNLLAMALRPDQLQYIRVESELLTGSGYAIASAMMPGQAKKFIIHYEHNFWSKEGYSGDILSIQGPIIWAMEGPRGSHAANRSSVLIGYLKVRDDVESCEEAVIEQLVKLFGQEAAKPISYRETDIIDTFIPRFGNYVALRKLTGEVGSGFLEWGALDVFADGDVAAAIEAGHTTYVRMVSFLRPQARTYDDFCFAGFPLVQNTMFSSWFARVNVVISVRLAVLTAAVGIGVVLVKNYMKK